MSDSTIQTKRIVTQVETNRTHSHWTVGFTVTERADKYTGISPIAGVPTAATRTQQRQQKIAKNLDIQYTESMNPLYNT
jgi:hypothetical protein